MSNDGSVKKGWDTGIVQTVMDYNRRIYILLREDKKFSYFIQYDSERFKVSKEAIKNFQKRTEPLDYCKKKLAQRWLDKECEYLSISVDAKRILNEIINDTSTRLY